MHNSIIFSHLSVTDFSVLKAKFKFTVVRSFETAPSGEKVYTGAGENNELSFLFEYYEAAEIVSFLICSGGKEVYYHFTDAASTETIQSLIRGNINKFCLQQQGYFCLHAAGIVTGNSVLLFIGQKGAGKSTLATWFHLQGHAIWADDYCVLEKQGDMFLAYQGETSLKINPDTALKLNIPQKNLESVFMRPLDAGSNGQARHIEGKYYFTNSIPVKKDMPLPVAAICILEPRSIDPPQLISRKDKADAFKVLMNEMLMPGLNSKDYLRLYFQSCNTLLDCALVYSIHSPDDFSRINEVYNAILNRVNIDYAASR